MQFGPQRALDALDVDGRIGRHRAGRRQRGRQDDVHEHRARASPAHERSGPGARTRSVDSGRRSCEPWSATGPSATCSPTTCRRPTSSSTSPKSAACPVRKHAVGPATRSWLVGLGEERFRPLGTMSTGQRQRVKLAQSIAADPSLILLDEPTDGLDPVQRDEMLALIRQISAEYSHRRRARRRTCSRRSNGSATTSSRSTPGGSSPRGGWPSLVGDDEGVVVELVDIADAPRCGRRRWSPSSAEPGSTCAEDPGSRLGSNVSWARIADRGRPIAVARRRRATPPTRVCAGSSASTPARRPVRTGAAP